MGLGFTTSGRLDKHNMDDNTRSREHILASGDAKRYCRPRIKTR